MARHIFSNLCFGSLGTGVCGPGPPAVALEAGLFLVGRAHKIFDGLSAVLRGIICHLKAGDERLDSPICCHPMSAGGACYRTGIHPIRQRRVTTFHRLHGISTAAFWSGSHISSGMARLCNISGTAGGEGPRMVTAAAESGELGNGRTVFTGQEHVHSFAPRLIPQSVR